MILDQEAIEELKEIYFQDKGIRLSDKEAIEMGLNLIEAVKTVYGGNSHPIDN